MKLKHFYGWSIFLLSYIVAGFPAFGADEVPCIVLSGNSQDNRNIDLSKYNRISFGEDSMRISSSSDTSVEEIELLYALYNHLQVLDATPTDGASVEEFAAVNNVNLSFNQSDKILSLDGTGETLHNVGIFNLNGELLLTCKLRVNESCNLQSLNSGVYIAVSTDGKSNLCLKFINK